MNERKESTKTREKARTGTWELRKLYGQHISKYNLFMPLSHYIPMMLEIQASVMTYRGVKTSKWPCDAWVYQEMIFLLKPDVIIEIGNLHGGSCLMYRDWMKLYTTPRIIGIDINHSNLNDKVKQAEGIFWLEGDAKSEEIFKVTKQIVMPEDKVMVIDDSEHTPEHTYKVLKMYSELVTPGQYFIVEDTILGNMVPRSHGEFGADVAVESFLKETDDFEVVTYWQKWFITNNPGGFLQRVKGDRE